MGLEDQNNLYICSFACQPLHSHSLLLFLQKFDVGSSAKTTSKQLPNISPNQENPSQATVKTSDGQSYTVNCGSQPVNAEDHHYISTQYHDELINELLQSHKYHDMCIIGPKVCSLSMCLILCAE